MELWALPGDIGLWESASLESIWSPNSSRPRSWQIGDRFGDIEESSRASEGARPAGPRFPDEDSYSGPGVVPRPQPNGRVHFTVAIRRSSGRESLPRGAVH
jgi:hypothetical protein